MDHPPGDKQRNARVLESKSLFFFGASQSIALVTGFVLHSVVARHLLPAEYARFVVASTILLSISMALVTAVPKALARSVSIDHSQLKRMWTTMWWLHVPVCLLVAVLLFSCATPVARLFDDDSLTPSFAVISVDLVLKAGIAEPCWLLLNGLGQHRIQAILIAIHGVFRVCCVSLFLLRGVDLVHCFIGLAAASLVSAILAGTLVWRLTRTLVSQDEAAQNQQPDDYSAWLRLAPAPELITSILAPLNLWILESTSPDSAKNGVFAACFTLAHAIIPLGLAVPRAVYSTFSSLTAAQHNLEAARLLRWILRGISIFGGLGVTYAFIIGEQVVELIFGHSYGHSGILLGALSCGCLLVAVIWLLGDLLNASHQLRVRFYAMIGIGVFEMVLASRVIPIYGAYGAFTSLVITGLFGCSVLFGALRPRYQHFLPIKTISRCMISGIATTYCGYYLIHANSHVTPLLTGACAGLLYPLFLKIMGEPGLRIHYSSEPFPSTEDSTPVNRAQDDSS